MNRYQSTEKEQAGWADDDRERGTHSPSSVRTGRPRAKRPETTAPMRMQAHTHTHRQTGTTPEQAGTGAVDAKHPQRTRASKVDTTLGRMTFNDDGHGG